MIDIYLATPYTHDDKKIEAARFIEVTKMAGKIMKLGYTVYSPITHCHPITLAVKLPGNYEFWRKHCLTSLEICKILAIYIYMLPGYDSSTGVSDELARARMNRMPVIMFKSFYDFKTQIKNYSEALNEKN